MKWRGDKLKELVKAKALTQEAFSEAVGVTRPTYNAWINGQVPKGIHLIKIWKALGVKAEDLFDLSPSAVQILPLHGKRGTAKNTETSDKTTRALAESFAGLFDDTDVPSLQIVAPVRSEAAALNVATEMRKLMGLENASTPPTFLQVLHLLDQLKVCAIFTSFPKEIKDYAFYTQLRGSRVVFINTATSVLDLVFPVLHEAVHAIRPVLESTDQDEIDREDDFCDKVASFGQPRDEKFRKEANKTLHDCLMPNEHVSVFLKNLEQYSPRWFVLLKKRCSEVTVSKLAEYVDVSHMDAKEVKSILCMQGQARRNKQRLGSASPSKPQFSNRKEN
jgi:transcriptional regulator with XRE-family HTH domain